MIDELLKDALSGKAGEARETARTLSDPALLPEFERVFARKLKPIERKIAYEFFIFFARNSNSPAAAAFLLSRLGAEKTAALQLKILGDLWLLEGLDCGPIEPFLGSDNDRLRFAAIGTLSACNGDRPVKLLHEILRQSAGGEEARQCAKSLARCGNETSADVVIEKLGSLEKSRANYEAEIYLFLAAQALAGPRHHDWFRSQMNQQRDPINRWLVFSGFCKHASAEECDVIETEIYAYLEKPTGQINLLTGFIRIDHRDIFQVGMACLQRLCTDRFKAVAARALAGKLPSEDREMLESLSSGE